MDKKTKKTNYSGSETTADLVGSQIKEKYGSKELKNYNPILNCRTYLQWVNIGYRVNSGEKALKSFIIIKFKNKNGILEGRKKTINLFYIKQVTKI